MTPEQELIHLRQKIRELGERLKKIEPCAASSIEMQSCVVRDVRWIGRELCRLSAS